MEALGAALTVNVTEAVSAGQDPLETMTEYVAELVAAAVMEEEVAPVLHE